MTFSLPYSIQRAGIFKMPANEEPLYDILPAGKQRIELMLEGRGWVKIENDTVEMLPGHLLWHIEGDETISRSDWKNPYACLSIQFDVPKKSSSRPAPQLSHWESIESAFQFSAQVLRWYVDEAIHREGLIHFICGTALIQANRKWGNTSYANHPLKTQQIIHALENRFKEKTPLKAIADEVGCSLAHLHNAVKEALGTTPHEVILTNRVHAAKELLVSTDQQVKEIAVNSGFGSATAFCQSFKQRTGTTPLEYRRSQLQA
ncbi:AraC family transcriptional regulator [Coraliomargarita parva]|uniref:AraC family transcriptional regulator n=1 Tax=Coraliomargarita parva TaxID=3014050 RepID=UPI0022B4B047|nr:AraC family transcriptional regulator [Coraliomargarita parva]